MFRSLMERLRRLGPLFLLVVCAPTALAVVYFGAIASDVYVSESRFIVRSPEKAAGNGLGMLFKATGFARAGDEIYAAHEFIGSRDALATLDRDGAFRRAYSGDAASLIDRFDPLGFDGSREALFRYYLGKVRVRHDTTSSITTLETRAFTPQDAERINRALLEQAEALVNRINNRGRRDLIAYPRYLDPVTRLPCPPEVLVQRLAEGTARVTSPLVTLRQWQGRIGRWWQRLGGRS